MSMLAEIEAAIQTLRLSEMEKLATILEERRSKTTLWPLRPSNVDWAVLAQIAAEFLTLQK